MSVSLMALVFNCNMPELKTDDGKTVPDTTAKFVLLALADNANEEGEGAYPGVDSLCNKTNYSTSTVCNALNALRHNGFTTLVGRSKRDTNNYTVSVTEIMKFQRLKSQDSSHRNATVSAAETNPSVNQLNKKDVVIEKMMSIGMFPNGQTADYLDTWKAIHSDEKIMLALDKAKGKNQKYADSILRGWEKDGYPMTKEERVNSATPNKPRPTYTPAITHRAPPMRD